MTQKILSLSGVRQSFPLHSEHLESVFHKRSCGEPVFTFRCAVPASIMTVCRQPDSTVQIQSHNYLGAVTSITPEQVCIFLADQSELIFKILKNIKLRRLEQSISHVVGQQHYSYELNVDRHGYEQQLKILMTNQTYQSIIQYFKIHKIHYYCEQSPQLIDFNTQVFTLRDIVGVEECQLQLDREIHYLAGCNYNGEPNCIVVSTNDDLIHVIKANKIMTTIRKGTDHTLIDLFVILPNDYWLAFPYQCDAVAFKYQLENTYSKCEGEDMNCKQGNKAVEIPSLSTQRQSQSLNVLPPSFRQICRVEVFTQTQETVFKSEVEDSLSAAKIYQPIFPEPSSQLAQSEGILVSPDRSVIFPFELNTAIPNSNPAAMNSDSHYPLPKHAYDIPIEPMKLFERKGRYLIQPAQTSREDVGSLESLNTFEASKMRRPKERTYPPKQSSNGESNLRRSQDKLSSEFSKLITRSRCPLLTEKNYKEFQPMLIKPTNILESSSEYQKEGRTSTNVDKETRTKNRLDVVSEERRLVTAANRANVEDANKTKHRNLSGKHFLIDPLSVIQFSEHQMVSLNQQYQLRVDIINSQSKGNHYVTNLVHHQRKLLPHELIKLPSQTQIAFIDNDTAALYEYDFERGDIAGWHPLRKLALTSDVLQCKCLDQNAYVFLGSDFLLVTDKRLKQVQAQRHIKPSPLSQRQGEFELMDVNGQSIVVGLSKGWVKVYDTRRIGPIGRSHNSYSFANNPVSKDTGNLFKSIEVTPKKNVFCDYKDEGYLINSEIGLSPQWPEGIYQNTIWIKNRSPIRKFDTEHLLLNSPDIVSPVNRSLLSISNDEEEIIWHDQQYLFRLLTKPKSVRTLSFSQIFNNENPRIFYAMHQRQKPNFITIGYHQQTGYRFKSIE